MTGYTRRGGRDDVAAGISICPLRCRSSVFWATIDPRGGQWHDLLTWIVRTFKPRLRDTSKQAKAALVY
jgi:hypothetical protein